MALHILYSPAHREFVADDTGKYITTDKPSPTRADAPASAPPGCHWMQCVDEDDSTVFQPNSPVVKRGEPTIVMRGAHAVRLFPLVRK